MENEEKESMASAGGEARGVDEDGSSIRDTRAENIVERYERLAQADPESETEVEPAFVGGRIAGEEDDLSGTEKGKLGAFIRRNRKKIMVICVLSVLATGALAAYHSYEKPPIDPGSGMKAAGSQADIVKSAWEKMGRLKTLSYEGKVSYGIHTESPDVSAQEAGSAFTFTHEGVADLGASNPDFYTAFTYDRRVTDKDGSSESKGAMEAVYLDKAFYAKVDRFSQDGEKSDAKETKDLRGIEEYSRMLGGSWYLIPEDTVLKQVFPPELREVFSSEMLSGFRNGLRRHGLLAFKEDLGEERLGEADTYHYEAAIDSAAGFDLALELARAVLRAQGEEELKAFEEELRARPQEAENARGLLDMLLLKTDIEVWIGKDDGFIHRLRAEGVLDRESLEKLAAWEGKTLGAGETSCDFSLDYSFSDFDTAAVRKPENAQELDKALAVLEYQGKRETSHSDPDADGDGLSDKLETLYGSDAKKADTDGDGYTDGDEAWKGFDPLTAGSARTDYGKIYDSLVKSLR